MFTHRVVPYLKSLADGVIVSRTLKLFGIGESSMEAQLREQMNAMANPTLAPYAKEGECELRVTAKAATQEEAQALLLPTVDKLKEHFGPLVYGVDVPSLEFVLEGLLKEKGLTLAPLRAAPAASWPSGSPTSPGPPRCSRGALSPTPTR